MNPIERRNKRRVLLIIDCAALVAAFFLALSLRYDSVRSILRWQQNLYSIKIVVEVLIYALIFHYRYHIRRRPFITEQDPVDGLISVIKGQILLTICLLSVLFATHIMMQMSRLVFGYMFIFNIVFMYILRMVWRQILRSRQKARSRYVTQHLAVIVYEKDRESVIRHLEDTLPATTAISNVIVYDHEESRQKMYDRMIIAPDDQLHTEIFVALPGLEQPVLQEIVRRYGEMGFDVHVDLSYFGYHMTDRMLRQIGDYSTAYFTAMTDRCRVLHTDFAVTDLNSAVMFIRSHVAQLAGEYLCYSNVHTTVMARENADYAKVQEQAAYVFPDGKPIADIENKRGFGKAERIGGPDFMELMFRATMDGSVCHYFYGSDEETIQKLEENLETRYPGIVIAGLYSPPYRALTAEEDAADMARINAAIARKMEENPDCKGALIWIGLGAPKQENWMLAHKGVLNGIMLGVGAGFNFHAGTVKRAPKWMQKVSLEWLYRLCQDPKRLLSRYFITNTKFVWYCLTDKFNQ